MIKKIENKIQENVPLASLTTIQLGGTAKLFVECDNEAEILSTLTYANNNNISVHVLGNGSNTIFSDQGFDGLIIKISNKGIAFSKENGESHVTAGAGELWDDLIQECVDKGLSGFECLSGIPGLVGAAPVQNIGAYGQEASSLIVEVSTINRISLKRRILSNRECRFGYRTSLFKKTQPNKFVITKVLFKAKKCDQPNIIHPDLIEQLGGEDKVNALDCSATSLKAIREAVLNVRQRKSMVVSLSETNSKSCGSFFMNPVVSAEKLKRIQSQENNEIPFFQSNDQIKIPAAWLIEEAGFPKGFRYGGVGVSPDHNLALINYDGTTEEIMVLAQKIRQAVKEKYDIDLVMEPNLIPPF